MQIGYLRLVDVGTAASAAVPRHLLLVVCVGIRYAYALCTLYVLARCVDIHAKELADDFFHDDLDVLVYAYSFFRIFGFFLMSSQINGRFRIISLRISS